MEHIVGFASKEAEDVNVVGGKGAGLGTLVRAGLPVPPGFVITTAAYQRFVTDTSIAAEIAEIMAGIDHDDPDQLDAQTSRIRGLYTCAELPPDLAKAITEAYRELGEDIYVAVRSSGTAEDLAEASFAGQHDTHLDIRGPEAVLDAVRRCWASLWTARATAYRHQNGFDHSAVGLAVVVQTMVAADTAGVLFTAHPMTNAVDELVIDASWGLGESVVSGIVTPDQFVLDRDTLRVKQRTIGSKELKIVRDPSGVGTREEPVAPADQVRASLTDAQLAELGALGRRVSAVHGGWPQDIEWASAGGRFYLLQARDITGVEFSWDEDLEDYTDLPPADDDTVWTSTWAEEVWTGAISPLFYSVRGEDIQAVHTDAHRLWGLPDVATQRLWKYHRGEVLYNSKIDYEDRTRLVPPALRQPSLYDHVPPAWRKSAPAEPFSFRALFTFYSRVRLLDRDHDIYRWFTVLYRGVEQEAEHGLGLPVEEIRRMSDPELKRYIGERLAAMKDWSEDMWTGFFVYVVWATSALGWVLQHWCGVTDPMVYTDLISGSPKPTKTREQNMRLWDLAGQIRESEQLMALFRTNTGAEFFDAVRHSGDFPTFVADYEDFLREFGHRGQSDRDIIFDRRSEDPGLDYRSLQALLTAGDVDPDQAERELIARREALTAHYVEVLRKQPLGAVRAEIFKVLLDYVIRVFMGRDDSRHHTDRLTFAKKRALQEVGRRLVERGQLRDGDLYFLSKNELFALLDGRPQGERVLRAKIEARRRNFERYHVDWFPPAYLQAGRAVELAEPDSNAEPSDVLVGLGTARGQVTGTARIVPTLKDIGRVEKDDILIVNSTDPGWTPVFMVISGLVLETGGLLAHGSCVSREYGIPAVTLRGAKKLIPDGATISVNGDTGEVRILSERS